MTNPGFALAFIPAAYPPASGGDVPCAPGIASRIICRSVVDASDVVTVNVPVSEPVDHLYAQPIAIDVVVPKSPNSVNPPPQPENSAPVLLFPS